MEGCIYPTMGLCFLLLGKEGRGTEARPATWAPFGAGGASGATGYLVNSEEVARVRRVLSILLVALGRPARRGCWTTEPEWGRRRWGMGTEEERRLPKSDYSLDETADHGVVGLRRQNGVFVAALSAQGATREGIVEAAAEDYKKLIEANARSLGLRKDVPRKRSA
jgi:hypothetical protein